MLTEMSERFYVSFSLALCDVGLHGPEAHHLANVSRLREGERVILFNGDGREYAALVQGVNKRHVTLTIDSISSPNRERSHHLELAVPLPRGDRGQFLIEKLTELGVSAYVPLQTQRSVVHPSDAKMEKLERYVIEASKQCGRNSLMSIAPLAKWETYARGADSGPLRWLAHPGGQSFQAFQKACSQTDAMVAVGPEGGWTDTEVELAQQTGWQIVDLGPRILRVETAAIALAALLPSTT
ncbi:16S rRNA (uracil(1498)-N(3))-methyltransferase [soil metagenome]